MTVQELVDKLAQFPPEMMVMTVYDASLVDDIGARRAWAMEGESWGNWGGECNHWCADPLPEGAIEVVIID